MDFEFESLLFGKARGWDRLDTVNDHDIANQVNKVSSWHDHALTQKVSDLVKRNSQSFVPRARRRASRFPLKRSKNAEAFVRFQTAGLSVREQ